MNQKGFTLIELIATLALITLTSVMIIINLQGISDKQSNKQTQKSVKAAENAACLEIDSINFSARVENYFSKILNEDNQLVDKYNAETREFYKKYFIKDGQYLTRELCLSYQQCEIPLKFLIQEGIIDADEKIEDGNGKTKTYADVSDKWIIEVKWIDYEKICTCVDTGEAC